MNSYVVAKYLRLSSDDGLHGDSESITGQRRLIDGFISSCPDLKDAQCIEFCDDGFSGTNFSRPGVDRMLNSAQRGHIQCIIVKDFSRFGRNYIEVGCYIEQIFPFLRVRFISLNDGYDSEINGSCAGDVFIAFKHIYNDYYCKELSRKVKTGFRYKWEAGKCVTGHGVYGYCKNPKDIHQLIIDEITAPIVKRVFDLAISGKTPTQIATLFNTEGVPTPLEHLCNTKNFKAWSGLPRMWNNTKITEIIRDIRYTGTLTQGMYAVTGLGSKQSRRKHESEWYITENTHEAIVTKDEYERAQLCIRKVKSSSKLNRSPYTFPVKIRCGGCGHALVKNGAKEMAYYCRFRHTAASDSCFTDRINVSVLRNILLTSIQRLFDMAVEQKKAVVAAKAPPPIATLDKKSSLQKKIDRLSSRKRQAYKRYRDGRTSSEDYIKQRDAADEQIKQLTEQMNMLEHDGCSKEADAVIVNPVFEIFDGKLYPMEYSNELVAALVDYVVVHDENRVQIIWKFPDAIITANEKLQ